MDTTTNVKQPAAIATEKKQAPSVVSVPSKQSPPPVKPEPVEVLTFDPARYPQYKVVSLRLLQEGIIQYDPSHPELILNTVEKRGKKLPLTPFFVSRLGRTIELVLE